MPIHWIFVLFLLLVISPPGLSQVHKCVIGGQVIYQQQPCADNDGQELIIESSAENPVADAQDLNVYPHYSKAPYINIPSFCEARYPNDYSMRLYCTRDERQKQRRLNRLKMEAPTEALNYCYHDNDSWSSRYFCVENQKEAYDIVSRLRVSVPKDIIDRCILDHDDWSSRRYCIEREDKARRQLLLQ